MDTECIYQTILRLELQQEPVTTDNLCIACNMPKELLSSHLRILEMFHRIKMARNGHISSIKDE